jgi:hypothetical protein
MWNSTRSLAHGLSLVTFAISACSVPPSTIPRATPALPISHPQGSSYHLRSVTGTHGITVRPLTNAIQLTGYTDTTQVNVELLRVDRTKVPLDFSQMVVIATATSAVDGAGSAGINVTGGGCFSHLTPTILPDDVIRVTLDNGSFDESKVAQVSCIRPRLEGPNLLVHGNATTGFFNDRLPIEQLAVQLVSKSGPFEANGQTVLRAAATLAPGMLAYDEIPVNPGDITAAFNHLSGADLARGVSADVQIVWLGPNPAAGNESTLFELPADPNAAAAVAVGCFPGIANAITTTDHPYLTLANAGTDLQFGGTAAPNVSEVSISVNQGPSVKVVLPQEFLPIPLQRAWSLTVPAAQVGPLSGGGGKGGGLTSVPRGSYSVDATFTTFALAPTTLGAVSPAQGFFHWVLPDVTGGPTVLANPSGGSFTTPQAVELNLFPPTGQIFYTTDGTLPSPASNRYQGRPIWLNNSTNLQYFALLPNGSQTPVQTTSYAIGTSPVVNADPPGGTYFISQYINLSVRQPGSIYYTLDGTPPTIASTLYTGTPILIAHNQATTALKYMAIDPFGNSTPVATSLYTLHDNLPPTVQAKPPSTATKVTLLAPVVGPPLVKLYASEDARIFYTTDGTEPTSASPLYHAPGVVLTHAMLNTQNPLHTFAATLKFMAIDLAGNPSSTGVGYYKF